MSLQPWQKIYVNRSLNMATIDAVGFDMDHTLAMYNHAEFETLAFKKTLEKFIEAGYPKELSELQFDPLGFIRGLLVDSHRGNILKVDEHKYVKTAYHGKDQLSKDDRYSIYNAKSFKAEQFHSVDTFFALSETQLYAEIIDYMRKNPKSIKKTYLQVFNDLRKFIDLSHADGSIKNEVMNNPQKYFNRDKYLRNTLNRLLDGGKRTFLITNSNFEYSNAVLSYLLNDPEAESRRVWKDFFDLIVVSAAKPKFFTERRKFLRIDEKTGEMKASRGKPQPGVVYSGGNALDLEKNFGVSGDEILYVGDHIYGDVINPKGLVNWRTMLVVEELDRELSRRNEIQADWTHIKAKLRERDIFDEEVQKLRSRVAHITDNVNQATREGDNKRADYLRKEALKYSDSLGQQESKLANLDIEIKNLVQSRANSFHPKWGELMKVGLEKSRFANLVERYACLYTSRVTNLRFYAPTKRFVSFQDMLPHEIV